MKSAGDSVAHTVIGTAFNCSPDVQQSIANQAHFKTWPPKSTILHSGEPAHSVYLVIDGDANAIALSLDGRLVLVNSYGRGDIFGEGCLLGDLPMTEDVITVGEVQTAQFRSLVFVGLIEKYSSVALSVSRVLTQRIALANRRMIEGATLSSNGRIYAELLRQARLQGGNTIRPAPVLSELALRVQTARETVSRAISILEKRGIIKRDAESLTIVAPHRLEDLIH